MEWRLLPTNFKASRPHPIFSSNRREYDRRVGDDLRRRHDPAWRHHAVTQLHYKFATSVVSTDNTTDWRKGTDASKYKPPKRTRGIWIGQLEPLGPRIPFIGREKAAYIKLRRVGLSINQISKAFGRSTSCVFRILKNAEALKTLRRIDIRKLPYKARLLAASFRWARMLKLLAEWEAWICGEEEEPP